MGKRAPGPALLLPGAKDCERVEGVRSTLRAALAQADLETWVIEIEADGASRTLLVNGRDVTGRTREDGHACRLELPRFGDGLRSFGAP